MGLSTIQRRFTRCLGHLIGYAYSRGYELTMGDAYRSPRVYGTFGLQKTYSAAYSVHKVRLAQDLNLFVDGKYIAAGDHVAYADMGAYWESLDPDARWGGRFGDANHFSFEYQGYK